MWLKMAWRRVKLARSVDAVVEEREWFCKELKRLHEAIACADEPSIVLNLIQAEEVNEVCGFGEFPPE